MKVNFFFLVLLGCSNSFFSIFFLRSVLEATIYHQPLCPVSAPFCFSFFFFVTNNDWGTSRLMQSDRATTVAGQDTTMLGEICGEDDKEIMIIKKKKPSQKGGF